jgi:hypothetical protein
MLDSQDRATLEEVLNQLGTAATKSPLEGVLKSHSSLDFVERARKGVRDVLNRHAVVKSPVGSNLDVRIEPMAPAPFSEF